MLTDEATLKQREKAITKAFDDSACFEVKPKWSVYSDSIHVELVNHLGSAFDELINILNENSFLKTVTIWVAAGKQIKTTKHKKRLYWHGGDCISKQQAKELLEQAAPVNY
jgi:hypothetical protein